MLIHFVAKHLTSPMYRLPRLLELLLVKILDAVTLAVCFRRNIKYSDALLTSSKRESFVERRVIHRDLEHKSRRGPIWQTEKEADVVKRIPRRAVKNEDTVCLFEAGSRHPKAEGEPKVRPFSVVLLLHILPIITFEIVSGSDRPQPLRPRVIDH